MQRRAFLSAAGLAAVSAAGLKAEAASSDSGDPRRWVQIKTFWASNEGARAALLEGLDKCVVKNHKAIGFERIGLFTVNEALHEGDSSFDPRWKKAVILVTESPSLAKLAGVHDDLLEKIADGDRPEFTRDFAQMDNFDVSLHRTFPHCPLLDVPNKSPDRVLQLRRYYSPSLDRNRAKREMFDTRGELDLFRACGMNPVFFSETVFGNFMPNITYMLSFENNDKRIAGWNEFVSSPKWKELSTHPDFANTATKILNLFLTPAPSSDI